MLVTGTTLRTVNFSGASRVAVAVAILTHCLAAVAVAAWSPVPFPREYYFSLGNGGWRGIDDRVRGAQPAKE